MGPVGSVVQVGTAATCATFRGDVCAERVDGDSGVDACVCYMRVCVRMRLVNALRRRPY